MSADASWSSRLASQHPLVAARLAEIPHDRQVEVAAAVAQLACSATGLIRPEGSRAELERLVAELDEKAWDLQDAESEHYPQAFATARAANAWLYLVRDSEQDPAEAMYEALAAMGSEAPVLKLLTT